MSLFNSPVVRATDANGLPVSGAKLFFYASGTTAPATVYTSAARTTAHPNPVVADSGGLFAPIYLDSTVAYRAILKDSGGSVIQDLDPIDVGVSPSDLASSTGAALVGTSAGVTLQADLDGRPTSAGLAASGGSALVGFLQSGTGAQSLTAQAKLRQRLDARDFGGTWDGTVDNTTALQAAINEAVARGGTLYLPPVFKAGAVTVGGACRIEGARSRSIQTSASGTYTGWTISSSDVEIRNLEIHDTAKSGGSTFAISCGTTTINRTTLKNILSFDSYGFLTDSGSGVGYHVTTILEDIQARQQRGPGFALTRMFAYGSIVRCAVEFIGVSASNFTAFMVDGSALGGTAGGLTITDCNAGGTAGVYTNTSQIGYDLKNFSDITVTLARADSLGGNGFQFTNLNKLEVGKALAQLCDGHGHVLTTVINSDILLLRAMGRNSLTGTASKDGVQIVSGCFGLSIDRVFARDMTGHGLNIVATQPGDVDVGRVQMLSNTGRGVKTVGTSAVNIGGGQCAGNTAGNIDIGGSQHFVDNLQINAGTKADYGPGPVTA